MTFGGFYHGRRVLVTGDTGFKGSWLCHWLIGLGADVHGIALPPDTTPNAFTVLKLAERIHHVDQDVRDEEGVRKAFARCEPEVVFHLAAQPLVREGYRSPKWTFDVNVGGTVNVLESMRASKSVKAGVVVTTDKCYENREWFWGYRETDPLGGHDPYSASKAAAEIVAASYRTTFFSHDGVNLATARAGNVIGGGDWSRERIVSDFVASISAGRALTLRSPRAVRPWQHVLEPLAGYLHLGSLLSGSGGGSVAEAWNFGPSDVGMVTVEKLARELVEAWGSGEVTCSAADQTMHEAGLLKLDCSKAAQRLGWRGLWDVPTTVRHTVEWYKHVACGGDATEKTDAQIAAYVQAALASGMSWSNESKDRTCTNG